MNDRNLYIIAGCDGAGKTTASFTVLPDLLKCKEFVNADEIARGLSPFQPEKVAFESGRIMLKRIDELFYKKENFAIETTLATQIYKKKIIDAKADGYNVTLLFFWLDNVDLAKQRVETRVSEGGHNIESDVIERRYESGIINLFEIYLPIVDQVLFFDNTAGEPLLIAESSLSNNINILNKDKFHRLKEYYDSREKR
jgi:predicted ABC-type ATPase